MWKLNKSIAKELLPSQPVDFKIDPWWGVGLVNFTLEEFKVRFCFCCHFCMGSANHLSCAQVSLQFSSPLYMIDTQSLLYSSPETFRRRNGNH